MTDQKLDLAINKVTRHRVEGSREETRRERNLPLLPLLGGQPSSTPVPRPALNPTVVTSQLTRLVGRTVKRNGNFHTYGSMSTGELVPCVHACLATAVK